MDTLYPTHEPPPHSYKWGVKEKSPHTGMQGKRGSYATKQNCCRCVPLPLPYVKTVPCPQQLGVGSPRQLSRCSHLRVNNSISPPAMATTGDICFGPTEQSSPKTHSAFFREGSKGGRLRQGNGKSTQVAALSIHRVLHVLQPLVVAF